MDRRCVDWRLSAYLDGELGAEEAEEVGQHLAACAECRARLRALRRISLTLHEARPRVPHSATARRAPSRAACRPRVWRWAVACALGVGVALGVRAGVVREPASAAPAGQVRATVDFRNNRVVTLVSWSARDREPGR